MNLAAKVQNIFAHHGKSAPITNLSTWCWGLFSNLTTSGWLWIDDKTDHWAVTLASDSNSHTRINGHGPAIAIDIDKQTGKLYERYGLLGAWTSALSMWPVRDLKETQEIFSKISEKIETVYNQLPKADPTTSAVDK